ncbi:RNA polymerase sigma factor [Microbacterium sp. G2-8]|uniref:RNA polymerase sigma factor n=1 Tax=Microbacterium sp. G2-8 TaxID=2842454 RepID=UPI001C8AD311|nr:RNA polymerase sigma factor [Microbacterium sp. G2-8]
MSTDSEDIAASIEDPGRFAEIFERHSRAVGGYVRRRLGVDGVDDVLSETFLVAFRRRASFDADSDSARPWLLGIATRLIKRHRAQEATQWRAFEHASAAAEVQEDGSVPSSDARLDAERALRELAPRIEDEHIVVAREALREEIRGERRRAARRQGRRLGVGIGALVGVGAAAAVAIATVQAIAPPTSVTTADAAADVLEDAADIAISGAPFDVPEGAYLRIESAGEWLAGWDDDMPEGAERGNGDIAAAEAAWVISGRTSMYVPRERADDWFRVVEPGEIVAAYGDTSIAAPDLGASERDVLVASGGVYSDMGAFGETDHEYTLDGRDLWDEMPTDAGDYLEWARERVGEQRDSTASDSSIVESIVDDPSQALAPPEVRAAQLRALALLAGSEVRSVDGDVTTIRFSWSSASWDAWTDIAIDTERALVLGVTSSGAQTGETSAIGELPTWSSRTTFAFEVVDDAPESTT